MRHGWEKTDKRSAANLWWRRAVVKLRDSSEQEAAWLDCDFADPASRGNQPAENPYATESILRLMNLRTAVDLNKRKRRAQRLKAVRFNHKICSAAQSCK